MSSTTISSSSSSSSTANYRVNYSDYVSNITNSPKSTRKLPSATAEHYISSVIQTNTNRNSPTVKTTINMPHYGGGSEKCARCTKNVYLAERRMGAGRPFHSSCYNCFTCHRKLETATLSEHKGEIYCKSCYTRQFGAHGLISGVSVSTEKSTREYRSSRRSSFGSDLDAPIINYQENRYRSNSSDNLLREDYDKPTRRESNQQPSRTIDVTFESQSTSTRKPSGGIVVVDTTFRRPSSPIKTDSNTYDRFQPISNRINERDRRGSQSDGLSPSRGTSAFIDVPVVIQPRHSESTVGRIELPTDPTRDNRTSQSRSPSPSSISNHPFQRQNSRGQSSTMTDSYSAFSTSDKNYPIAPVPSSINTGIIKIGHENPLISENYHRSSSASSSSTYERKYQASFTSATGYTRENFRSRESSPVSSITARRSPSPVERQNSSTMIQTSTTSHREGIRELPTSTTSAFIPRGEYHRDSVSTSSNASGRRSPSPSRNSALNELVTKTTLTSNSTDKYSTLRALAKPSTQDGSDDDFDS